MPPLPAPLSFNFSRSVTAKREEGTLDTSTSSLNARPGLLPLTTFARKKKETEVLEEGARELLSHFNHQNTEALLKVTRNTLEAMRRRIHSSNLIHFRGNDLVEFASWLHAWSLCVCACIPAKLK